MDRGQDRGKLLCILDTPWQEEAARREFVVEGLVLNSLSGSRYLGDYLDPQEELEAWVEPQAESWTHGVRVLGKIARRHPQLAYAVFGISLQLKWQ